MTSTVPSIEDFTNAFPNHLSPIVGEPTYQTLKELKNQLKANAASIPTTLGGGHHGYLGLILSPAAYATISPTAFTEPAYPGQHPTIPAGTNAATTSAIIRRHTEDTRQWREFKNVSTALKNQLLSAVDDIYVRALRDRHVGYMNQTIRNLLTHLFDNYGNITQLELEDNDTKMRALWDPNSPFDCLVQQLEDGQDYADDGGQPYTTDQLLRIAYTLVFKTGLYFEDCKAWNAKPNNEKTWTNFKAHFQRAQRLLRDQLCTTKQAGFTSNFAMQGQTQPPPEYRDALVNLATSAAVDRELLNKLATTVASINDHINLLNKPPIASVTNSDATTSTALSSVTGSIVDLQKQIADLQRENTQLRQQQPQRPRTRRDNGNYCWTHGYRVGNKHTSATCQNKAPGHQDNATREDTMGGSEANKPSTT